VSDESGRAVRRPEVWLNCAASMDGRIALAGGRRAQLSGTEDLRRVQALRARVEAILVGVGTVILDDPSLRVHWELLPGSPGTNPRRIVVDASGRTPPAARVLDGSAPTLVATSERCTRRFPEHIETLVVGQHRVEFEQLWPRLVERGVRRLLVEGGAEVLASVVRSGLFDRFTIYYAPLVIGGKSAPTVIAGDDTDALANAPRLRLVGIERIGEGSLATYLPAEPSPPPGEPR
jgi:2,5-diamino-6-(ribosylamino)-4(3H)-pyrimidinone 5'-phosphate reductase